ncbi:MAG: hypothetical protein R3E66_10330 [bacterium]
MHLKLYCVLRTVRPPTLDVGLRAPVEYVRRELAEKYGAERVARVHRATVNHARRKAPSRSQQSVAVNGLRIYTSCETYWPIKTLEETTNSTFSAKVAEKVSKDGFKNGRRFDAIVTAIDESKRQVSVRVGDQNAILQLVPVKVRVFGQDCDEKQVGDVLKRGVVVHVEVIDAKLTLPAVDSRRGQRLPWYRLTPKRGVLSPLVGGSWISSSISTTMRHRPIGKPVNSSNCLSRRSARIKGGDTGHHFLTAPGRPDGKTWSPQNSDGDWRSDPRPRGIGRLAQCHRGAGARVELASISGDGLRQSAGIESKLVDNFTMVMGSSELTPLETLQTRTPPSRPADGRQTPSSSRVW